MAKARTPAAELEPILLLEIELSAALPALPPNPHYRRALALVRLHTQPLGSVALKLDGAGLDAGACARLIWAALQQEIVEHLRRDGLAVIDDLPACGLLDCADPPCLQARRQLLATAPFITVIVATHNRPASIEACVHSLLESDYPAYEILVADNAPASPATAQVVQRIAAAAPRVRYLREDRPGGAWARNRALREARGEIVAFIDDDVLVDRHWLAALLEGFTAASAVACVTGLIRAQELETPAQIWIEQYGGFSKGFQRRIFNLTDHRPAHPLFPFAAGLFGSGANTAFRTAVLRQCGGFDPAIGPGSRGLGGEDLAAFFQVVTRGYTLVYEPAAIVRHSHYREYSALRKQVYGYGAGLTAYLTKSLVENPRLIFECLSKIPFGLYYIFSGRSPKNVKKLADYPRELTWIERWGMVYGPLAYLRGRRQAGKLRALGGLYEAHPLASVAGLKEI